MSVLEEQNQEVKEIICLLLRDGSILKNKLDPKSGKMRANLYFDKCSRLEDEVNEVLWYMNMRITRSEYDDIYFIRHDQPPINMHPALLTYVLCILKTIYEEKLETSLDIFTNLREIRVKGEDLALLPNGYKMTEMREVLKYLKRHNVIVYSGGSASIDDDTKIYITDMIKIALSNEKVSKLENAEADENEEVQNEGNSEA